MSPVEKAVMMLDLSLTAAKHTLHSGAAPLEDRLTWFAGELERLAGEAYRLADEGHADACAGPIPGFDDGVRLCKIGDQHYQCIFTADHMGPCQPS